MVEGNQVLLAASYSSNTVTLVGYQSGVFVTRPPASRPVRPAAPPASPLCSTALPRPTSRSVCPRSNTNAGVVSPSQLVFTPQNWNIAQTVTVTGVNDFIDHGSQGQAYTIITAPVVSTDPTLQRIRPERRVGHQHQHRRRRFAVTPTTGLQTSQAGGTASFTVALTSAPQANVAFLQASSNTRAGTVAPASLTFTPQNWNVPQTVTVTGVNDGMADGNVAYTIVAQPAASTDPLYNQLTPPAVPVTNLGTNLLDLQVANLAVTPSTNLQSGQQNDGELGRHAHGQHRHAGRLLR